MPENAKGNNKNNGDGVVIKLGDIVYRADGLRGSVNHPTHECGGLQKP